MSDNQKNQKSEDTPKKTGQHNQNPQQKVNNPTQSTIKDEEGEESTDNPIEYPGEEHQHDYKTPTGEQNRTDTNQNRDAGKDQSPNRGTTAGNMQNDTSKRS